MDSSHVDNTRNLAMFNQPMSPNVQQPANSEAINGHSTDLKTPLPSGPSNYIHKVSLVKLAPLENKNSINSSPLSPDTLTRLVEEQAKSHEAIEALQQRIQAETPNAYTSEVRKTLEESALKQRQLLDQVLSTPEVVSISQAELSEILPDDQPRISYPSENMVSNDSPLVKRLFPDRYRLDDDVTGSEYTVKPSTSSSPGSDSEVEPEKHSTKVDSTRKAKKSDTDNDTGVESDSGSDAGVEIPSTCSRQFITSRDSKSATDPSSVGEKTTCARSMCSTDLENDQLFSYLEAIEERALAVQSLVEKAKLDTVLNIRRQIEAEFNGVSLGEIPAKCHQKIDRAIQRYLQRELEKIKAEYERKGPGIEFGADGERIGRTEASRRGSPFERENGDYREKIESLQTSLARVDMLHEMQKKENEYLTAKIAKLERQMANEKLKYEDVNSAKSSLKYKLEGNVSEERYQKFDKIASLCRRLDQEERKNKALKIAGEADQTTIRCLKGKLSETEGLLESSRKEVGSLLSDIRQLQDRERDRETKLRQCEVQLLEAMDESRVLRETLVMSEHEVSLLEQKLGNENSSAWKENKREILEELRKLEKHIRVIHKEKRKLENRYLAFKIENENLSDSLNSFSRTKDILTPLGSCDVSRRESALSSHSSSLSSSVAGSDAEDDVAYDSHRGNKNRSHPSGRRRRRGMQDHKDKQFAEAVAKKLLFAQKTMKDQNCNFSSFENSGQDLLNEADELTKRVDSLQAEKRAIKMELESIRSAQTENVKC